MSDTQFIAQGRNVWSPLYLQIPEMKSRTETADTNVSHTFSRIPERSGRRMETRAMGSGRECASHKGDASHEGFGKHRKRSSILLCCKG